MKITILEKRPDEEDEIIVKCDYLDENITKLLNQLKTGKSKLSFYKDSQIILLNPEEILFFESVDDKVFAYTKDGNLIIDLKYEENYKNSGKSGWFSAGIDTDNESSIGFNQKYGYFECRCILPETKNAWSAFWLMNEGVYNVDGNGKDGTEIDVFESNRAGLKNNHKITSSLHYDGYNDAHKKIGPRETKIDNNPYQNFNTYGVLWEEDKYTFYVNGKKTFSTNFGGVSQNPEYLILSVEINGENGITNADLDKTKTYSFIIDYVRAYTFN